VCLLFHILVCHRRDKLSRIEVAPFQQVLGECHNLPNILDYTHFFVGQGGLEPEHFIPTCTFTSTTHAIKGFRNFAHSGSSAHRLYSADLLR